MEKSTVAFVTIAEYISFQAVGECVLPSPKQAAHYKLRTWPMATSQAKYLWKLHLEPRGPSTLSLARPQATAQAPPAFAQREAQRFFRGLDAEVLLRCPASRPQA